MENTDAIAQNSGVKPARKGVRMNGRGGFVGKYRCDRAEFWS
ncbi:hypothetical protein [Chroococcidiopsis sp. SAG 2025]|nr:hypothetical protein [Chroococcidiopsis sp. SAG 2025]